jgi:Uma2 family endonuclease
MSEPNRYGPSTNGFYTYGDYQTWPDDMRYEIVDGRQYMFASPSGIHQLVSMELGTQLNAFLKGGPCMVIAEYDVRLNAKNKDDKSDNTVFRPDLLVLCDKGKWSNHGIIGAPELVIEIASPSTRFHDTLIKFEKYREAGVMEYWIVDTQSHQLAKNVLVDNKFATEVFGSDSKVPVHVLKGCVIDMGDIFRVADGILETE